jgi:hypothetical protein
MLISPTGDSGAVFIICSCDVGGKKHLPVVFHFRLFCAMFDDLHQPAFKRNAAIE